MLERLAEIEKKYTETEKRTQQPEVYTDPALYAKLAKEQKELLPIIEAYRRRKKYEADAEGARELLGDPELRDEAREELDRAKLLLEKTDEELKLLLLPRDPNDDRNVIMEIRAGIGGEEAALFAADLYRMYTMYAEKKGYKVELINANETELGGFKEISFTVIGEGAYSRLKFEAGGHCVKRVPETESSGRIQTSTATVAVLPEAEEMDFAIDPADLKIDTFRSSGAGGQKVNKTESAIRVTHIPTGVVVECQDERSQYKNKDRAISILRSKLYEAEREKRDAAIASERRGQVGTGERSEKIRTYFYNRSQVTDKRLTGDGRDFPLLSVLNGDLDGLVDALITADNAEKLGRSDEN